MTTDARMEKVATGVRGRGVWEHFTVLDGLPDMKVECLAEDRDGMIWVGTHDGGAARYDGEHFECFSSDDGLSCDSVYSITEGLDGIIWFGTSRGLTKYDGKTFEVIDGSQEYSFLWGACVDDDGVLWFGLDRRPGKPAGVIRCDGGAVQLIEAEEEPSISIHSMVLLEGAVIATGHRGYVASEGMTPLQWQLKDVRCMVPTSRRSALAVSAEGVFRVSLTEVERISREPAGESVAAGQGRAWVATRNGRLLLVADGEIADEEVSPLPTLWRGAMVSKNGGLWLSSFGAGISCYDSVVQTVLDARHLPDSSILSLAYSRDGTLWMGLATGLRALNTDGVMYAPMAGHILSSKPVTSLCATESGELWVGTRQGSVFTIEDFTIWAHEAPPELSALSVADIVSDGPTVYYRGPGSRAFGTLAPTLRRI
ncbi:MAG: hypothetical protein HN712_23535, partial [Gemmatimonadetes bacterium]|nr:hypothetical protein [Gemmatimonadota bacterium]